MQYRDRVLVGTPIPLVFKFRPGAQVSCAIQHSDNPAVSVQIDLVEVPSPAAETCFYVGSYVPATVGWYYATALLVAGDASVGMDATRFYCYAQEDDLPSNIGEAVVQEIQVKVGSQASLAYRGLPDLTVVGRAVYEADTATPDASGLAVPFSPQTVPTGFSPLYLASFTPTREGKYYVYVKTTPAGGEALIVVNAFKTLPYSRAAGTIKSSATSTVT